MSITPAQGSDVAQWFQFPGTVSLSCRSEEKHWFKADCFCQGHRNHQAAERLCSWLLSLNYLLLYSSYTVWQHLDTEVRSSLYSAQIQHGLMSGDGIAKWILWWNERNRLFSKAASLMSYMTGSFIYEQICMFKKNISTWLFNQCICTSAFLI